MAQTECTDIERQTMNQKLIASSLVLLLLTGCSDLLGPSEAELAEKQRITNEKTLAEVKSIVSNATVSNIDKLRAIDRVRTFDPSQADSMQKAVMADVDKKVAENEKQLDQVIKQRAIDNVRLSQLEKKRKKQEGVSMGMTMQDVLDSSWGRPQHKTNYHSSLGTKTIWQYGEYGQRGSIIFDNGIVTGIQN